MELEGGEVGIGTGMGMGMGASVQYKTGADWVTGVAGHPGLRRLSLGRLGRIMDGSPSLNGRISSGHLAAARDKRVALAQG